MLNTYRSESDYKMVQVKGDIKIRAGVRMAEMWTDIPKL